MTLAVLDTVVLEKDVPEHSLRKGDVGAIVEVHSTDTVEVEFVRADGHTHALLSLEAAAVRRVQAQDLPAFRPVDPRD